MYPELDLDPGTDMVFDNFKGPKIKKFVFKNIFLKYVLFRQYCKIIPHIRLNMLEYEPVSGFGFIKNMTWVSSSAICKVYSTEYILYLLCTIVLEWTHQVYFS